MLWKGVIKKFLKNVITVNKVTIRWQGSGEEEENMSKNLHSDCLTSILVHFKEIEIGIHSCMQYCLSKKYDLEPL